MNVTEVTYEQLRSLSTYENHRGKVTIALEPGDDPNAAFQYAKDLVIYHLTPKEKEPEQVPAKYQDTQLPHAVGPLDVDFARLPLAGTLCPDCGEQQRRSPHGLSCRNGHGYGDPEASERQYPPHDGISY